jgi:hypothetical protein
MPRPKSKPIRNRQQLRLLQRRLSALLAELAAADRDASEHSDTPSEGRDPHSEDTTRVEQAASPDPVPDDPLQSVRVYRESRDQRGNLLHASNVSEWAARHIHFVEFPKDHGLVDAQRFFEMTRVVNHDNGILHLFKRFDPLLSRDVFEWHPHIFALAKVVHTHQNHVQGCNGYAGREADGFLSKFIFRCGCPTVFGEVGYEWVIEPKNARPVWLGVPLQHRQRYQIKK